MRRRRGSIEERYGVDEPGYTPPGPDELSAGRPAAETWALYSSGLALVGGVAFIVALFLDYVGPFSVWDLTTRWPVLLTILAAVVIVLALAALIWDALWLCLGQAVVGAYLLGQVFPLYANSYQHLAVGFWLESVAALAMMVGGTLATLGNARARASCGS